MKVLVFGLGSAGDVHPSVGLCQRLRQRGHEVRLTAASVFRPLADRLKLDFDTVGSEEEYLAALNDPDMWHPLRSFHVVARRLILPLMRPVFDLIAEHYVPGETVVVAPATAFGARIAQEKLGVPLATIHLQPSLIRSYHETPVYGHPNPSAILPRPLKRLYFRLVDWLLIDRLLAGETNAFRAGLGLAPASRLFENWYHSPELVLGFFPDWFAPPQPDWPPRTQLVGFPLYDESGARDIPPELDEFLNAGEPPLIFTAGSAMRHASEYFAISAEVCRRLGRRGLLLAQFAEQIPAQLPDGVRHFEYAPFSQVLPRAAGFAHHGGIGTTAQAFAAGVPQLVVPLAHDQFDQADRVRRLGAGAELMPENYSADRVERELTALLESRQTLERCRQLARKLAGGNALDTACELIERIR